MISPTGSGNRIATFLLSADAIPSSRDRVSFSRSIAAEFKPYPGACCKSQGVCVDNFVRPRQKQFCRPIHPLLLSRSADDGEFPFEASVASLFVSFSAYSDHSDMSLPVRGTEYRDACFEGQSRANCMASGMFRRFWFCSDQALFLSASSPENRDSEARNPAVNNSMAGLCQHRCSGWRIIQTTCFPGDGSVIVDLECGILALLSDDL